MLPYKFRHVTGIRNLLDAGYLRSFWLSRRNPLRLIGWFLITDNRFAICQTFLPNAAIVPSR